MSYHIMLTGYYSRAVLFRLSNGMSYNTVHSGRLQFGVERETLPVSWSFLSTVICVILVLMAAVQSKGQWRDSQWCARPVYCQH